MITTKKGDKGQTSLFDGTRVAKDDPRIELNGQLDELNAVLGLCKATASEPRPYEQVQLELMQLMALVANGYRHDRDAQKWQVALDTLATAVGRMEGFIAEVSQGRKFSFVLPGASLADAYLHLARTKVRTCERRLVSLAQMEPQPPILQTYLNRLSDYLFCLAQG